MKLLACVNLNTTLLKNLLHNIYKKELCISPIPSLAVHFTNINSIYGLSPNVNWKKLWEENEN